MQIETVRGEAYDILNKLPEIKLTKALSYLQFLRQLPDEQVDALEDLTESLGWSLLASEVAEKEWQ